MFTTFAAGPNQRNEAQNERSEGNDSSDPSTPPRPPQQKRSQVARACDWCRLNRIRCDNDQPCRNCLNMGRVCSNNSKAEARSISQANAYVHRLNSFWQ